MDMEKSIGWLDYPDLQVGYEHKFVSARWVLGLLALGCHWVMSTLRIEDVITGSLDITWYYTWSISELQVITVVLCHELG